MSDVYTDRDPVNGWESVQTVARYYSNEELDYLDAKHEAEDAWKTYQDAVDRFEDRGIPMDEMTAANLNSLREAAVSCDEKSSLMYHIMNLSDGEYRNQMVLARHSVSL